MHLLQLLQNDIIRQCILSNTDGETLARLSLTSRSLRTIVEEYYSLSLSRILVRYFQNTQSFVNMLRAVNGCITGSQALQLLMNDASASWQAKDLDISVPLGSTCYVCEHLVNKQGYTRVCDSPWSPKRLQYHTLLKRQCLKSVVKLRSPCGCSIDILESNTNSCISPLCEFHSTSVINAVFADKMTCYFPHETLRYRTIRNVGYQRPCDDRAVAKYTGRGWQPLARTSIVIDEVDLVSRKSWSIGVCVAGRAGTADITRLTREGEDVSRTWSRCRTLLGRLLLSK